MTVDEILSTARLEGASDVHMIAGQQPMMRIKGSLQRMNYPRLSASMILDMMIRLLPPMQREYFEEKGSCITTYEAEDNFRYRVNAYRQQGMTSMAIRLIPGELPGIGELPQKATDICLQRAESLGGLMLLSGHPGGGKSTTLAMLGQYLCQEKSLHVMTLGRTIEAVISPEESIVSQRALAQDAPVLAKAIEESADLDVDVLLVDMLAGAEAVKAAVKAAGRGMLVLATVNVSKPGEALQELSEEFPLKERGDILRQLKEVLCLELYQEFLIEEKEWKVTYRVVSSLPM